MLDLCAKKTHGSRHLNSYPQKPKNTYKLIKMTFDTDLRKCDAKKVLVPLFCAYLVFVRDKY